MASRRPIPLDSVSVVEFPTNRDDSLRQHQSLVQSMLYQNMSIDHVAELMAENPEDSTNVTMWRNRIMRAVTKGDLTA